MGQNVYFYFWLFHGPWGGGLQWSDWAYLAFQLSSYPYLCTCEYIQIKFKSKILKNIWGGGSGGPLRQTPGLPNFQGSKTSTQSRQMYNKATTRSPEISRQQVQKLTQPPLPTGDSYLYPYIACPPPRNFFFINVKKNHEMRNNCFYKKYIS